MTFFFDFLEFQSTLSLEKVPNISLLHFRLNIIQTLSMNCSNKHDLHFFLFQVGPPCIGFNYILPTTTAQEISFNFRAWLLVGGERSRCKKLWRKEDERRKRRSFTGPTMGSKPI